MSRITLDPHQFFSRLPLAPHQLRDRLTRVEDAIVLCHLGIPRITREAWSLSVDGLVTKPLRLTFDDLMRFPHAEVTTVHQCAGSPLKPFDPSRRVCNVTWGGARLADVLAACGLRTDARYVWSTGADFGEFSGVTVDAFVKDLPIERAGADVLIAYEMNGAALAPEHGFPARLAVPGFYGTNSVKWLTRLTLADARAASPFTTRWYNDPAPNGGALKHTVPVWSIAPQSLIVVPAPNEAMPMGSTAEIWGWAWSDGDVAAVEVAVNGEWRPATLEPAAGRAWQRFALRWAFRERGTVNLASRAISKKGDAQPGSGSRNAVYSFAVTVT
jgi:DMSO/TMAO reductase YedYZ molybdopterin-dependent catalytic subunit